MIQNEEQNKGEKNIVRDVNVKKKERKGEEKGGREGEKNDREERGRARRTKKEW